jgi:carbon monoxide dehydrogenase subunit G
MEIIVNAPVDAVWSAVRDVYEVHRRLVPGVLVDAHQDGDTRVVTFANGLVARELIVTLDDAMRRFAYASVGGRARHHNASIQVLPDGEGTRLIWTTDVLPDELAAPIMTLVEQGAAVMKQTLERAHAESGRRQTLMT